MTRTTTRRAVFIVSAVMLFLITAALTPDVLADTRLPEVLPDSVDTSSSDPASIMVSVVKFVIGLVLWVAIAVLALKTIIEAIKDIKEARDGDSKWVSAGKSIAGGIFFFVLALAIALWIQGTFLS